MKTCGEHHGSGGAAPGFDDAPIADDLSLSRARALWPGTWLMPPRPAVKSCRLAAALGPGRSMAPRPGRAQPSPAPPADPPLCRPRGLASGAAAPLACRHSPPPPPPAPALHPRRRPAGSRACPGAAGRPADLLPPRMLRAPSMILRPSRASQGLPSAQPPPPTPAGVPPRRPLRVPVSIPPLASTSPASLRDPPPAVTGVADRPAPAQISHRAPPPPSDTDLRLPHLVLLSRGRSRAGGLRRDALF